MSLARTHYIIRTEQGSIGCQHVWMRESRISIGREIVSLSCVKCPRFEKWMQLARPRSGKRYMFTR